MRLQAWAGLAVITVLAACATVRSRTSGPDERFDAGMKALAVNDFKAAEQHFTWVAEHAATEAVGHRALLILSALQLDPRNSARRTENGSAMAARYLNATGRDTWADPVALTLYLLGSELGDAEDRADRAEAQTQLARQLPKLPGPTVIARIRAVEQERDKLAKRVSSLEEQLAQSQRELERIRKTIKP
ncbi:MAG TPA: hypothetical protein VM100_10090 [Longimicrobiales bacterium]|nr:hypothetical protein [Longimicrobiales bacterium]